MSATNPPPIRVPASFAKDREVFAYFSDLHTFLRLLWTRTGGGEDAIAATTDTADALMSAFSHAARIESLRQGLDNAEFGVLLGLSALPDKAKIEALKAEIGSHGVLAFAPHAARYAELLEQVNQLRVEIAALYSERAKVAHLDNRINDLELLAWL
jgi:hypothetical protein